MRLNQVGCLQPVKMCRECVSLTFIKCLAVLLRCPFPSIGSSLLSLKHTNKWIKLVKDSWASLHRIQKYIERCMAITVLGFMWKPGTKLFVYGLQEPKQKKAVKRALYLLGLSAITLSRLCNIDATKRKIEHILNITVMGNASTFKATQNNQQTCKDGKRQQECSHYFPIPPCEKFFSTYCRSI